MYGVMSGGGHVANQITQGMWRGTNWPEDVLNCISHTFCMFTYIICLHVIRVYTLIGTEKRTHSFGVAPKEYTQNQNKYRILCVFYMYFLWAYTINIEYMSHTCSVCLQNKY